VGPTTSDVRGETDAYAEIDPHKREALIVVNVPRLKQQGRWNMQNMMDITQQIHDVMMRDLQSSPTS
jgi:hypothetical protein